jgi:hypothetical protein
MGEMGRVSERWRIQQERLVCAIGAVAAAELMVEMIFNTARKNRFRETYFQISAHAV